MEGYFKDTNAWVNKLVWNKNTNRFHLSLEHGSESTDSMKTGRDILCNS